MRPPKSVQERISYFADNKRQLGPWEVILLENLPGKVWDPPQHKQYQIDYFKDLGVLSKHSKIPVITEKGVRYIRDNAARVMHTTDIPLQYRAFIFIYLPFEDWAAISVQLPSESGVFWAKEAKRYYLSPFAQKIQKVRQQ